MVVARVCVPYAGELCNEIKFYPIQSPTTPAWSASHPRTQTANPPGACLVRLRSCLLPTLGDVATRQPGVGVPKQGVKCSTHSNENETQGGRKFGKFTTHTHLHVGERAGGTSFANA